MNSTELKILETVIVVVAYALLRVISVKLVRQTMSNRLVQKARGKIIKKALNLVFFTTCSILLLLIWGVDQSELAMFVSTLLTVIGIALFAQWSILSNITSSLIIFFNHSVKLEDDISIVDKDFEVEGRISDIGLFFIILKTKDDEEISIPNNVFIQKMVKKNSKDSSAISTKNN
ncbi:MAG: mechanosensitive ion channel [Flavobacteriales bacterium]|nr:mechanosensitive ion channel [Flavobacteriales bacterium]